MRKENNGEKIHNLPKARLQRKIQNPGSRGIFFATRTQRHEGSQRRPSIRRGRLMLVFAKSLRPLRLKLKPPRTQRFRKEFELIFEECLDKLIKLMVEVCKCRSVEVVNI